MSETYPHCNAEVLHAPGECHYCDQYPSRQARRQASNTPFTPLEANGWSGNVAVKTGESHTHMGATYVVGSGTPDAAERRLHCWRAPFGWYCSRARYHDGSVTGSPGRTPVGNGA